MKSKLLTIITLTMLVLTAFAQDKELLYAKSDAQSNWFISAGAGGQVLLGDNDDDASIGDRLSVIPTLSIGKWISPSWGVRLKGEGGQVLGFEDNGSYKQKLKYIGGHVDAMWNATNACRGYQAKRLFNFIPYAGIGFTHRMSLPDDVVLPNIDGISDKCHKSVNSLSINGGLMFAFQLSKRIGLNFDLGATLLPDAFDGVSQGFSQDAILSATGSLCYHIGKSGFDQVEPMDYGVIEDLHERTNDLRNQVAALSLRPESCPDIPEAAPVVVNEVNYIANVVFFRINSSKVDSNQQGSIFNTAEFMKSSGEKIKVIGYADRDTGTDGYNLKLSEKRARAVAHELVSKYNIPTNRIVIEWKGSEEQPYKENNWNRVVVMTQE